MSDLLHIERDDRGVVHAVLSLDNETQAAERCLKEKINRGTEAARAAVQIANVIAELRGK